MDKKKKKNNLILKILLVLFIIYFCLYLMNNLGYYNINSKNVVLTNEKIKEFEDDIKNGENIDIKNYINDNINYKNTYSNLGYNLSLGIDNIFNKGIKKVSKIFKKLFK
ncbi:MAG: hypothetical protein IJD92_02865 [Bacilli bacterium]|nr:hypothetical protein [Bacilli bacterium]